MALKSSALHSIEANYGEAELESFVRAFQEVGYVVLPDVYERSSVAPFRAALLARRSPLQPRARPPATWERELQR